MTEAADQRTDLVLPAAKLLLAPASSKDLGSQPRELSLVLHLVAP